MLDLNPLIQLGVKALAPKLFEITLKSASQAFQRLNPYNVLNFEDNFVKAHQRCTKVKTIISGDTPVDLLTSYVKLSFSNQNVLIDDDELIDRIWEQRNVVVSGPAGSGKSMFMKYLWISCFVQSRGKIPIFIELRQLNSVESDDFILFLFHSCAFKQKKDGKRLFDKAIVEGQFFFILDGFDELTPSKTEVVEREILNLTGLGRNVVVVSSRPNERFGAWLSFTTHNVAPLTKKQVLTLIERIDFDTTVKKKFAAQIRTKLYDEHKDFVSRPLLATMMLLTFNSFADIPSRIHVFYDQAFDTLFLRHDATKEAFKRKRRTDYAIDEFKRIFGVFCLITYVDQESDFTNSTIREYFAKTNKIAGVKLGGEDFLADLMESVCVMQREGLSIVFSHRSFQEYFCSYALMRLSREEAEPIALRLSIRRHDSVFPMLLEMNRAFFEDVYILPMIKSNTQFFDKFSLEFSSKELVEQFGCEILVQMLESTITTGVRRRLVEYEDGNLVLFVQIIGGNDLANFIYWLTTLYHPPGISESSILSQFYRSKSEAEQLAPFFPSLVGDIAIFYGGTLVRVVGLEKREERLGADREFLYWLDNSRFMADLKKAIAEVIVMTKRINAHQRKKRADVLSLLKPKEP